MPLLTFDVQSGESRIHNSLPIVVYYLLLHRRSRVLLWGIFDSTVVKQNTTPPASLGSPCSRMNSIASTHLGHLSYELAYFPHFSYLIEYSQLPRWPLCSSPSAGHLQLPRPHIDILFLLVTEETKEWEKSGTSELSLVQTVTDQSTTALFN